MKKNLLTLLINFFAFSLFSQISITASDMPVSGDTIRYSNARLSSVGDYTTTGANHTWHFDTLVSVSQAIRSFKTITQTPYSIYSFTWGPTALGEKVIDTVPLPNIPIPGIPSIKITNLYNFYSKKPSFTPTRFVTEGTGVTITFSGTSVPLANTYSDEDELYNFPLSYLDRDSTTFRFSTYSSLTASLIPITYIKQGHRITEVDGWGTVATPHGTVSCIRVVTTQYSIDTLKGTVTLPIIGTQPFAFGFPNYVRSYQWLTNGEHIPYFEVSGTLNGTNFNPNQARYRDNYINFVGIKEQSLNLALSVFPNPSTHQLTIITSKDNGSIKAELVDLQGKVVLSSNLNDNSNMVNQHVIDVSGFAKGMYILNLSNLEGKQSLKISIQ
jgi:hypothetical protein